MEDVLEVYKEPYDPLRPVNGVAVIFMMFEPLAVRRYTAVTDTRTRIDFAMCLCDLSDKYYRHAEKILLVMDNLNTHALSSLYEAFPPEEARRLAQRFEIHYTPKHASWLNEHVIGRLKRFRILSERYRNHRKRFALRFSLIAGICNFDLLV